MSSHSTSYRSGGKRFSRCSPACSMPCGMNPMFHEAVLHQDREAANRFMLYETWEDHEDVLQVQLQRPYRKVWHEALPGLLAAERDIAIWQPLRADHAARR